MMNGKCLLRALAGASLLPLAMAAPANAQNRTYLELQGGLGYSSNPELRLDGEGSAFGRISAYGFHGWGGERSSSNVSAYVENSSYFRRYGNRQLFSLSASNTTRVSEKLAVFGNLGFSGDYGAQLGSRFFGPPADSVPLNPLVPQTSVILVTPDLLAVSQRQYRVSGAVGASYTLSAREVVSATFGAQRLTFGGNQLALLDQTAFDSTLAYRRQVNERTSVGARLIASHTDYPLGQSVTTYGPQLTGEIQLSENLQLGGAIGFVRTEQDLGSLGPNRSSTDLALDGSVCRTLEYERFCGRVSRRTQSASIGLAQTTSSLGADYSRRLSFRDQVQASLSFVSTDGIRQIGTGGTNLYSAAASYDRRYGDRLSGGVSLVARKLTVSGADPKADIGASLFIRNRFGSVR